MRRCRKRYLDGQQINELVAVQLDHVARHFEVELALVQLDQAEDVLEGPRGQTARVSDGNRLGRVGRLMFVLLEWKWCSGWGVVVAIVIGEKDIKWAK